MRSAWTSARQALPPARFSGGSACPTLFLFIILAGCGYPGEPFPPALKRPAPVIDLSAVERGSKIVVQFTIPELTTEGLPIAGAPDIELRIGPMPAGAFTFPAWEKNSERISGIESKKNAARAEIDTSNMYGKSEVIGVRVHGPHGRSVGWSRLISMEVVPALAAPAALEAKDSPDAIRLDWHGAAPEYRVFRRISDTPEWTQIAISDKPFYSDATIDYGKTYQYYVQATEKAGNSYAESEPSETIAFKPADKFPPAVPTGLTAVPGPRSIELVWDRNAEKDFAGYRVYRDGKRVGDGITAPAFSDRDVKPGTKYRYQLSAEDTAGNESALSAPVEAVIP